MAGHSKWANIRHKKGRADAKKGKVFSRAAKEIITAVKEGGPDPKANARLRLAIQKAKAVNVPNEVVDRNIKKASSADQAAYQEITYEIYGHGGVGIICEVMTDNKNRSVSEVRIACNKKGGSIGSAGSVAFNFSRKGTIRVLRESAVEEELFETVINAGAEDFEPLDDAYMITTDPSDLLTVKEEIDKHGIPTEEAEIQMLPQTLVDVDDEIAEKNMALIQWLEELDDVDAVYHNMNL